MSLTKKTIVVEDRFREIFNYLPDVLNNDNVAFAITFKSGDRFELKEYLKTVRSDTDVYPLIWLVTPFPEEHTKTRVNLERVSFVLAVETNSSMLYEERIKTTFKKLFIIFDNIRKAFKQANILDTNHIYEVIKFANYSGDENLGLESETGDNWDALKITLTCDINDICLKKLNL